MRRRISRIAWTNLAIAFERSGLDVDVDAVGGPGIVDAAHRPHIDAVGRDAVIDQHLADGQRPLQRQPPRIRTLVALGAAKGLQLDPRMRAWSWRR